MCRQAVHFKPRPCFTYHPSIRQVNLFVLFWPKTCYVNEADFTFPSVLLILSAFEVSLCSTKFLCENAYMSVFVCVCVCLCIYVGT